jgi:hypothetical protein
LVATHPLARPELSPPAPAPFCKHIRSVSSRPTSSSLYANHTGWCIYKVASMVHIHHGQQPAWKGNTKASAEILKIETPYKKMRSFDLQSELRQRKALLLIKSVRLVGATRSHQTRSHIKHTQIFKQTNLCPSKLTLGDIFVSKARKTIGRIRRFGRRGVWLYDQRRPPLVCRECLCASKMSGGAARFKGHGCYKKLRALNIHTLPSDTTDEFQQRKTRRTWVIYVFCSVRNVELRVANWKVIKCAYVFRIRGAKIRKRTLTRTNRSKF